jgi:type I restriction enzyme S subunit
MKKYDNYKDSEVEWIGEIPEHWKVTRLGFLASKIGDGLHGTPSYVDNSNFKFINGNNIGDGQISIYEHTLCVSEEEYLSNKKELNENSILMSINGTIGNLGFYKGEKVMLGKSVAYINIIDSNVLNFTYRYLESESCKTYIDNQLSGSTIKNLSLYSINKIPIPFPSIDEQTAIANYLDHKTTQLDTLIAKKQQFISLLQEERIAVINQAVTKGLDPTVKMKDSGIEWLGEIPEHWEIKKLKYIKSNKKNAFVDGPFGSNLKTEHFVENGDVYVIDSGLITSGVFRIKKEMKTITNGHFETVKRSECKQNDIIIAKIGANFGTSGILPKLDKPSFVSGNTLKLTVNEEMYDLKLVHLQLLNLKTSGEIDLLVKGSAQPALSMGVMSDLPFVIPNTLEEQVRIRNFILNQHQRIDELISKTKQEIELLKEYKSALISEGVTGKVDVRDVVLN